MGFTRYERKCIVVRRHFFPFISSGFRLWQQGVIHHKIDQVLKDANNYIFYGHYIDDGTHKL